ncbi:DrmB family protein [Sphaerimonospora mesophila]|uniref:DrmB family protein n=1 Tax=Sphaerimonospora mesophila TaxID=37483 RepID=UPI0006E3B72B
MALRQGRNRRSGGRQHGEQEVTSKPIGAVRRAQLITTYGVGGLVAIEDQSYIVSGLDTWKVRPSGVIYEPRLQNWLAVSKFHLPPADNPSSGNGVKIRLFPEIYSCPGCNDLQEFRRFGSPAGKNLCGACEKPLVPSRFVIACENGHLDDFPYFAWVHKKNSPGETTDGTGHKLSLHSTGRTASLRSILVKCSCGVPPVSLEGAFGRRAMEALGIKCKGRRPWLGRGSEQPGCTAVPRTLQRGSSATWFPINRSALSIPPWSESLQKKLNSYFDGFSGLIDDGASETMVLNNIRRSGILDDNRFTAESVLEAVKRRRELTTSAGPDSDESVGFEPANDLRRSEYEQLYAGTGRVERGEDFECVPPESDPSAGLPYGIARSMLVKRLREVRVLESFARVEMPDPTHADLRNAALSRERVDWLPAIEVSGEGVFLTIDQSRLREWEARPGPAERAERIQRNHTAQLRRRAGYGKPTSDVRSPVTPRYVLLHTLAHILINEWTLEAGYPAAALRERLYVSDDMAGLLIYTATSDSEGSLGGVVARGEHRELYRSLESALARAAWCSQDPPCIESEARGFESLNLAACHACVLLAETSCEAQNLFLDRALIVGTPEDPSTGFFFNGTGLP